MTVLGLIKSIIFAPQKNDNDEENKGLTPFHIHPHKEWHRYIDTPLLEL